MSNRGRKGGYDLLIKPRLDEIYQWTKDGMYEKDIIRKLGTSKKTFYDAKRVKPELAEVLRQARAEIVSDLKKSLIQRAKGYEYEETKVTVEKDSGGNIKSQRIEKVSKQVPPDTGALIFSLTNMTQREDDVFYNRQDISHSTGENDAARIGLDLKKLSLEELKELERIVARAVEPDTERDPEGDSKAKPD